MNVCICFGTGLHRMKVDGCPVHDQPEPDVLLPMTLAQATTLASILDREIRTYNLAPGYNVFDIYTTLKPMVLRPLVNVDESSEVTPRSEGTT